MKILDAGDDVTRAQLDIRHIAGQVIVEANWCQSLTPDATTEYVYLVYPRRRALLVAWAIVKAALTFRRFK